jgi:hypothetical protein
LPKFSLQVTILEFFNTIGSGAAEAISSIGLQFLSISVRIKPTILGAVQGAQSIISDRTGYIKQLDKAIARIPPSPPSIFIANFRSNDLKYSTKIIQMPLSMIDNFNQPK